MASEDPAPNRMSDEEIYQLSALLARYATEELDQFDHWRIPTAHGPVYIDISRACPPNTEDWYADIWPRPQPTLPA